MPNVRVSGTSYTNNMRSIVAIPDHYVALSAQIAATAAKTIDGKKYILAGTPVTNATSLDGRKTGLTVATGTDQFDGRFTWCEKRCDQSFCPSCSTIWTNR